MSDSLPPSPVSVALGGINALALEMAKRFGAIDTDGNIWCMMCNQQLGELPSLLCAPCLDEWRRGRRVGA